MSSSNDYEIRVATEADADQIIAFLKKHFLPDEPLCSYLQVSTEHRPELDDYCVKSLPQGASLVAIQNNKLIGVRLSTIHYKKDLDKPSATDNVDDEKFKKIFTLIKYVKKQGNPFGKYPEVDKALYGDILCVDKAYRGKGIAKALLTKIREIAKEKGCGFMVFDCTSRYSAKAMESLGFEKLYSINYADYKVDGEVVFRPAEPHKALVSFIEKIS